MLLCNTYYALWILGISPLEEPREPAMVMPTTSSPTAARENVISVVADDDQISHLADGRPPRSTTIVSLKGNAFLPTECSGARRASSEPPRLHTVDLDAPSTEKVCRGSQHSDVRSPSGETGDNRFLL